MVTDERISMERKVGKSKVVVVFVVCLLWYCRFADVNAGSQGPSPRGLRSRVIILGVVGGWTPSKGGANKIRIVTQKRKLSKILLVH